MTYAAFANAGSGFFARRSAFASPAYRFLHCRRRRPERRIEIAFPAVPRKIDASAHDEDALAREPAHLLAERSAAGRKRDPSVGAQHAMPWQFCVRHFAEDPPDEARAARQPRARRELAVARDAAFRNRADRAEDRRRIDRRAGLAPLRVA